MKIVNPNIKFSNTPLKRSATKKIVVHHADATNCGAQTIDKWHKQNGWSGIGYHFLVRKKDGIVETGRPIDTIGAHCLNHNLDSIGVCFEGNFEKETMSDEQLQTGKELIAYIRGIYGNNIQIVRHKDLMATSCPGKNFPFSELIAKEEKKKDTKEEKKTITYTVKKGDTLSKIGKSLDVKWEDIASLNSIKSPYTIQTGQVLKVPTSKAEKKTYAGTFPTLPSCGWLQRGDTGTQVKNLQKLLNWFGNYGLAVDGDFGIKTKNAVVDFQQAVFPNDKKQWDGLFGKESLEKAKAVKK